MSLELPFTVLKLVKICQIAYKLKENEYSDQTFIRMRRTS